MILPGCGKSGRKEKKKHVLNQCFAFAAQKKKFCQWCLEGRSAKLKYAAKCTKLTRMRSRRTTDCWLGRNVQIINVASIQWARGPRKK